MVNEDHRLAFNNEIESERGFEDEKIKFKLTV